MASHTYLTIGIHYCGGEAVETKIVLGKTQMDCGMVSMEEDCHHDQIPIGTGDRIETAPCCQNDYQTLEPIDEYTKEVQPAFLHVDFSVTYLFAALTFDVYPKSTEILYADNSPPLYEKDIQILFQTLLI